MKNLPEILSPVGNKEMLFAAVRAGADAVYLGAKDFNARRNADNFDNASLKEAIDYCHIRGVKIYLTLNILLKDSEIENALSLAFDAYNLGIDGIIVADIGFAEILHKELPGLPLHASTQMTVCNEDALLPLKNLGFCRVVAAREMSKSELSALCKKAEELSMEIEVFIHGALCMSMSGQCLLSALLGGRSGNRGLCAGPCRLPFSDSFGNENALSLKDLSLLYHLDELREMGVASLKIEGRMKRPEYVAAVTAATYQMLNNGYIEKELSDCVNSVFSRSGFTDGYFTEKTGKAMFGMRTKDDVTASPDAYPFLHEMIRFERQSVPIKIEAKIKENCPIEILFDDGENTVTVIGEIPEKALKISAKEEDVISSLSKLGATPYFAKEVKVDLDEGLNLRASLLNALRRNACEELDKKRSFIERNTKKPDFIFSSESSAHKSSKFWMKISDLSLLPEQSDSISAVILPIEKSHNINSLGKNIMPIADIPRAGLFGKNLEEALKRAKEQGFKGVMVNNIGHIEKALSSGLLVFAGVGLNIYSGASYNTFENLGFSGGVISPELTNTDINNCSPNITKICFAYGRLPLMLFKNCPASLEGCKGCKKDRFLTDRKGIRFPVLCRMGYSELLADRPIWLADRKNEFNTDVLLLSFTDETKEEIEEILSSYKNSDKCKNLFTRGLYYRGVE